MGNIINELIDCYEELELFRDASFEDIKMAFRHLVKRYHPDNKESGNQEKFISIKKAYEVLSEPVSRAIYDLNNKQAGTRGKKTYIQEKNAFRKIYEERLINLTTEEKIKIVLLFADTNKKFNTDYINRLRVKYFVIKMKLSYQEQNALNNIIIGFMIDIDEFLKKLNEKPKAENKSKIKKKKIKKKPKKTK